MNWDVEEGEGGEVYIPGLLLFSSPIKRCQGGGWLLLYRSKKPCPQGWELEYVGDRIAPRPDGRIGKRGERAC